MERTVSVVWVALLGVACDASAHAGSEAPSDAVVWDGATSDVAIRADDLLIAQDAATSVGFLACASARLRHADGTHDDVSASDALSIEIGDATIATPVGRADCGGRLGIIGLHGGRTTVTYRLRAGGREVRYPAVLHVTSRHVEARFRPPRTTLTIGATMELSLRSVQFVARDGDTVETPIDLGVPPWSLISLVAIPAAHVELEREDETYRVRGALAGATNLSLMATPPAAFSSVSQPVDVVSAGRLVQVQSVSLTRRGLSFWELHPGECFDARLLGTFVPSGGGHFYASEVGEADGAVWWMDSDLISREGAREPPTICARAVGDARIGACVGEECRFDSVVILPAAATVRSVNADVAATSAGPGARACLGVRAMAAIARDDIAAPIEENRDVSASAALVLTLEVEQRLPDGAGALLLWERARLDRGWAADSSGRACFTGAGATPPSGRVRARLNVAYGLARTSTDVTLTFSR